MTIYITCHRPTGDDVLCYTSQEYTKFVPAHELKDWIAQHLGLCNQIYEVKLVFQGIPCNEFDEFSIHGCQLDAFVESLYYQAVVYDHLQGNTIVWSERLPSEKAAAQCLFVWLVKKRWLDLNGVIDLLEMNVDHPDDATDFSNLTKNDQITHTMRAILCGEDAEAAEIDTIGDLWDWCQVIRPGFEQCWSFEVLRKCERL
jgi:hypothetical protein